MIIMETRMTLSLLINTVISDSTKQPAFIKRNKKEHKETQMIISNLLIELLYLVQDRFLTEKEIYKFIIDWYEIYMGFDLIESINLYFTSVIYISETLDKYITTAEQTEEYEVLSNLIKFKELKNQDNRDIE